MRLVERGFEHHKNILDEKNLDFLSEKFDLIFAENKNKIQNKEFKVKSIPDSQSFHFASNKERKLVGNLEFYEKNNERFLICIHNVEADYPEVKDFFFNTIYDNVFSELRVKGRLIFDRIHLIKKTEGDNHSMDWHRDSQFCRDNFCKSINVGVYLDESIKGRDAVSFLTGSHKIEEVDFNKENTVTVEANPGDAIVHVGSVFHESPVTNSTKFTRRTVYYRFLYEPIKN